jgi:hypothetical protein
MHERNEPSPGEDEWARIDELKRVAHGYLNEHHHETPTIRELPVAHYEVMRDPTWFAQNDRSTCGARGRIESNLAASTGTEVLRCARPKGHSGRHTAEPTIPTIFRLAWKVASRESPVDKTDSAPSPDTDRTIRDKPVLAPLSKSDRWRNRVAAIGLLLGVVALVALLALLMNGLIWQATVCFVIALVLFSASLISRFVLLRRYSGR